MLLCFVLSVLRFLSLMDNFGNYHSFIHFLSRCDDKKSTQKVEFLKIIFAQNDSAYTDVHLSQITYWINMCLLTH